MTQEIQSLVFLILWIVVFNIIFFGFLRWSLAEKTYDWRMNWGLMMEGVTKEDFVKKMKTISLVVLILGNGVYAIIVLRMLLLDR